MEREIAIKIVNLKKRYKLGQIGGGTLQGDLQSWWARFRGKEDPNSVIGSDQRSNGKTFMALNGVDLTVYKGEALGIIGHNGAGKSTLLKLLSRVTAPTEGEIGINGRIASMLEVGTGFNGEMTGRENIYMNGAILGMTRAEVNAKMEDIIEFSECREFIDTPVKRYSSGMYVKLAFSVAAHLDSEIMIMDEVLAVGDMAFQKKCLTKMREAVTKEGRTVLYVSHNMNTIRQLCSRCVVLDKGKVVFDGDVEQAIGIYMEQYETTKGSLIYNESSHPKNIPEKNYIIHATELLKNEQEDKFKVVVRCRSGRDLNDVYFRLEIVSQDGIVVGTMLSDNHLDFMNNTERRVVLTIDKSQLAPGRYRADLIAYQCNKYGSQLLVDGVYPGFVFGVEETASEKSSLIWLTKWWGHVRLHDIQLSVYEEDLGDTV